MNRTSERADMIEELQARNAVDRADMEMRRERRLLAGEPAEWDAPREIIRKQVPTPTAAPQADDDREGALIDAVVEHVENVVAPLRSQIANLTAELAVTRSLVASSNKSWLNKLRGGKATP